ncbi:TPA: mannose-6-phosphate isomerase, class I [Vibrio parahaemolyticus]|uniref:mannose-6-phosphate isomerase, class I n=1 Tax=Vibrio parahaemolyticus TaxID=670 RepID=UPI0004279E81|nr:mannose-6-phosphate isomerase, class I [Vibrio parahaemolyticus]KIT45325.1 mannose-6-phosphate isomerase [Vibrio parahaemolyticus EN9701121]EGQ7914253.1 mannose-6-phosphate isomerase, class I [Vibrio parahaemolyticus]EGW0143383.1 mannose-6-phosphate isomerase, class I [Vibrio parahaemolyticus]EHB9908387.1 mannose-6-phosphate isomerase, class I [Vibrio parahaemolyticus]EIA1793766.1 mannose-6-phosphate isomerase, class I [Vibrio parahaemolyticus]
MNLNTISSHSFFQMKNKIQNYAWGSTSSIHDLFGFSNETNEPQAEVWMGTHPNGCSEVQIEQNMLPLSELIKQNQPAYLSAETAAKFGDLPFLFKILAAEHALSIQVHPSKQDAEIGFEKEQRAGIPLNASHRNYKDPNHKPELVYALTSYQAMNGFRSYSEIIEAFSLCDIDELRAPLDAFKHQANSQGLRDFFVHILTMEGETKERALKQLLAHASRQSEQGTDSDVFQLILDLSTQYPGDVGLFAPLLLNVITLQPGEAMFLSARTPHAYIKGTGLEIMANSDNVLRAGLTPKHMDVEELVKCTDFVPKPFNSLVLEPNANGCQSLYPVPVADFSFCILNQPNNEVVEANSAEILMAIDADLTLISDNGETLTAAKGQSVFVPAYVGHYRIQSAGRVARAFN